MDEIRNLKSSTRRFRCLDSCASAGGVGGGGKKAEIENIL